MTDFKNIDLKLQKGRDYVIVAVVLAFWITFAFVLFVIKPQIDADLALKTQLEQAKTNNSSLQIKLDSLVKLEGKLAELKEKQKQLNTALPQEQQIDEILVQLNTMAVGSKLLIKNLTPIESATVQAQQNQSQNQETSGSIKTLTLQFNGKGTYPQFKSFLDAVEKNLRIIKVTTLDLKSPAGDKETTIEATITFEIYYMS